jgi:hypothetical protein
LTSTIKIAKVAKEGFGLASSYKRPLFPSHTTPHMLET